MRTITRRVLTWIEPLYNYSVSTVTFTGHCCTYNSCLVRKHVSIVACSLASVFPVILSLITRHQCFSFFLPSDLPCALISYFLVADCTVHQLASVHCLCTCPLSLCLFSLFLSHTQADLPNNVQFVIAKLSFFECFVDLANNRDLWWQLHLPHAISHGHPLFSLIFSFLSVGYLLYMHWCRQRQPHTGIENETGNCLL